MEEVDQNVVPPAPKIIHFVWAGGIKLMPERSMSTVIAWLIKNPDFTIYLWMDEKTGPVVEEMLAYYENKFQEFFYRQLKDNAELGTPIEPPFVVYEENDHSELIPGKIVLKDIQRNKFRNDWISYFIELPLPNYGCSSDLLREMILELGGAYFDSDVGPGPICLNSLPIFNDRGGHRLLLDDFTQVSVLGDTQLKASFGLENADLEQYVGNDVFASTKKNPLLRCFYNFSIKRFEELSKSKKEAERFALCYGARDFKFLTIHTTGPDAVRACIKEYSHHPVRVGTRGGINLVIAPKRGFFGFFSSPQGELVEIRPIRESNLSPIIPLAPTNNWLKLMRNEYSNVDSLKLAIGNVILFESARFNIVRIDDHIGDLIERSQGFEEDNRFSEKTAFEFICKAFPQLKSPQARARLFLQVTGKFEVSRQELSAALPKTLSAVKNMVACAAYCGEFCGYFSHDPNFREDSSYVVKLSRNYERTGLLHPSIGSIFKLINASLEAIEVYCRPHLEFFTPEQEIVAKEECLSYLQKFLRVVNEVIKKVPPKAFDDQEGIKPEELKRKILNMLEALVPKEGLKAISWVKPGKK